MFTVHEVPGPSSEKEVKEHQAAQLINDWSKEKDINYRKFQKGSSVLSRMVGFLVFLIFFAGAVWIGVQWLLVPSGVLSLFKKAQVPAVAEKKPLDLEVKAPLEIASGDTVNYEIVYTNNEKYALSELELIVRYPDNFNFEKAEPVQLMNASHNVWSIGSIAQGESKKIKIFGQILGEEGAEKIFTANLSYKPVNFHARFKETKKVSTILKSSVLSLSVLGPKNLLAEQNIEYVIQYKNNAKEQLKNIAVRVTYPLSFVFADSDPTLKEGEDAWNFPVFDAGAEGRILIHGALTGAIGEPKNFGAEIGFMENGAFRLQNRTSLITPVIDPHIVVDVTIEQIGASVKKPDAPAGEDTISVKFASGALYKINYKNEGDLELKNIVITLEIVDLQHLIKEKSFIYADGKDAVKEYDTKNGRYTLVWGGKGGAFLKDVRPGESDSVSFTVDISGKPAEENAELANTFRSKVQLDARSQDITVPILVEGRSVVVMVE
ncbi:MAG: hypothetical protein UW24_C0033G0004 [Parcubacteria group bacterium GW2011_GWA2_44_12]|nr:MAG: hypothetical protein UW24_C0033G0004 [Parcubacteria group bacterium GW2011_GWA2_44_12]